jgi:hypothetical protein
MDISEGSKVLPIKLACTPFPVPASIAMDDRTDAVWRSKRSIPHAIPLSFKTLFMIRTWSRTDEQVNGLTRLTNLPLDRSQTEF